jgi:hypothetical protein
MSDQQKERWAEIKRGYSRRQATGGSDDPVARVSSVLGKVSENLDQISGSILKASTRENGPVLIKLSPDSEVFQAPPAQTDLAPYLQALQNAMIQMGRHVTQALEKNSGGAPATSAPIQLDLGPALDRIGLALERLGQAGLAAAPQVVSVAASAPAATPGTAGPPLVVQSQSELGPVLEKLSRAIDKLASQPAARAVESHPGGVVPTQAPGAPAQVVLDASASSAMVGSLDNLMHFVPKLQQLGQRLRGPKAKVILMDPGLVRAFDAFKEIHTLADAVKALEQLDI